MKADTLERLLIDSAAGELSPDVRELLEDHLQHNPAAQKEAAEIDETLRLARVALADEKVVRLPSARPLARVSTPLWAMAACFVCGLVLGILALGGHQAAPPTAANAKAQPIVTAATPAPAPSFWSVGRFKAESSAPVAPKPEQVIWKSVFKKPEIL